MEQINLDGGWAMKLANPMIKPIKTQASKSQSGMNMMA
jgi:hypothetical protein